MLIEERNFPADTNGSLGQLRSLLVRALHSAGQSPSVAKLLSGTLSTAVKILKQVSKGTVQEVDGAEKQRLAIKQAKADAIKKTAALVKAAGVKLRKEGILGKKKKGKVSKSK